MTFHRVIWYLLPCLVMASGLSGVVAQEKTKLVEALQTSPSPANSIAYVHVPSLMKLMADENMDAAVTDRVTEVWQIAQIEPFTMQPRWEAGYAMLKSATDAESLAEALDGYVDQVSGTTVVWSPRQSYLIPRGDRIGFLRPADRTLLSDWITSDTKREAPAYLVEQAQQSEEYLSFMLAIDLENAMSPVALKKRLANLESLKGQDLSTISTVMASTKGVSVIIGRKSLKQCILAVEFGQSPKALEPFAKEALNEILNRSGSGAPEVMDWAVRVDGNKLVYQGAISESSLHGLVGILSIQGHAEQTLQSVETTKKLAASNGKAGPSPYETKAYFDRVLKLIERTEKYEAQTTGYRAKWNDSNAKRIDELSTVGVDPEMVKYGADVATMLRNNAAAIRGVNVSAGQQKAAENLASGVYVGSAYGGGYYGGYYGAAYGYYDPNTTSDYQMTTAAQATMAGFGSFQQTMTAINQMTGDIRRAMTDKYGTQF